MSQRKWKVLNNNYDWASGRTRLMRAMYTHAEPWGVILKDDGRLMEVAHFRSFGEAIQYIDGQERSQS